jgi:predicted transport protein
MTPWGVFRGTREEFLKYISIKKNKKNLEALDEAFLSLMNKEYIAFHEDGKHIIVYIREKIEEEMKLGSKMVKQCREIVRKHNKTTDKVPQLIKVWLAVQICF